MDKLYSFKNITKKPISVLINGKNTIVKPNEVIVGTNYFTNYKGLLKLNKPKESLKLPEEPKLIDLVSEISIYDNEVNFEEDDPIIEYNVVEELNKGNKMNKIDLSDVTFTIPLTIESEDRKENLTIILDYLNKYFITNVLVCEFDKSIKVKDFWKPEWQSLCRLFFIENKTGFFHKTKILNALAKIANTPIIVSYDCDVLLKPSAYIDAANEIREGKSDFCYPFNKPLKHIKKEDANKLKLSLDLSLIDKDTAVTHPGIPPGGCFFMNRNKFIEAGMENENMVAWGPEDQERLDRVKKLGYRVNSLNNDLYHIDHIITPNSFYSNPYYNSNVKEHEKIKAFTKEELKNYIKTFRWANQ
jgi:hypothetical protein